MPSRYSRLVQEYANLRTSGLSQIKIINEKQEISVIPKMFVIMAIFLSVAMTVAKSILPETEMFAANLIQHEERAKSYPDKLPNYNNPLVSNIE